MSRPQASCGCGESVDAPDSDFGRAVVAAFKDMHRSHATSPPDATVIGNASVRLRNAEKEQA